MRSAGPLNQAYEASPIAQEYQEEFSQLRQAFGFPRADRYGGNGRYPLNADYPYQPPGWQWSREEFIDVDAIARSQLCDVLGIVEGQLPKEDWLIDGPWLIPDIKRAQELKRLTVSPEQFEIIEVARHPVRTKTPSIGYDIGYWAYGNFSLICDCAVWPLWHPPDPSDNKELAKWLGNLNERMLFETVYEAISFRDFYRSRSWAETERENAEEFTIIEIAAVE